MTGKKSFLFGGIICVILVLGSVFMIRENGNVEEKGHEIFPIWHETTERNENDEIKMSFVRLSVGEEHDEIALSIENCGVDPIYYGEKYYIEYLENDKWYTVYKQEWVPSVSCEILPHNKTVSTYSIQKGLLSLSGVYRIYVEDLGYCEITIQ